MKELIGRLTGAYGPSGREDEVRRLIAGELEGHVDGCRTDALGNLIAWKGGPGPRIMLAAHMDEIGFMVTHVDENGFARYAVVGSMDHQVLLGQRVVFPGGRMGVIGSERVEKPEEMKHEKLFIDAGAGAGVGVGDVAVFHRPLEESGCRLVAKAMDDRVGCAILVEVGRRLTSAPNQVFLVFTAQEEVGLRGARTSAYGIGPDCGVAVDVTDTGDTPKARTMEVSLGKGPAVKVMDTYLMCHPGVRRALEESAAAAGTPFQREVLERGGTDAGAIAVTREGVPAGVVSIPTRYIHTPSEMVDYADVEGAVALLLAFVSRPLDLS
ncbi:MAG: M20/M25/M40 family metallo-hydrolase [bacterium]|nr:M20/M25/M40 family metallo-hydrolase [bacterium]